MMRSTLFIGMICATAAAAQESPTHGCYARDYGADHLAANPAQVVARMVLRVATDPYNPPATAVEMAVWTANQGHVAKEGLGNQRFDQGLFCYADGRGTTCAIECDGGSFLVERDDGDVLQFSTNYLMVGVTDECGGAVDIAEVPGKSVSYRLTRVPDALCAREFGN